MVVYVGPSGLEEPFTCVLATPKPEPEIPVASSLQDPEGLGSRV